MMDKYAAKIENYGVKMKKAFMRLLSERSFDDISVTDICKEAGVSLTPAGAPFPGGREEKDSLLRIAPTMPPLGELSEALRLIPLAVKLAYAEKQR